MASQDRIAKSKKSPFFRGLSILTFSLFILLLVFPAYNLVFWLLVLLPVAGVIYIEVKDHLLAQALLTVGIFLVITNQVFKSTSLILPIATLVILLLSGLLAIRQNLASNADRLSIQPERTLWQKSGFVLGSVALVYLMAMFITVVAVALIFFNFK